MVPRTGMFATATDNDVLPSAKETSWATWFCIGVPWNWNWRSRRAAVRGRYLEGGASSTDLVVGTRVTSAVSEFVTCAVIMVGEEAISTVEVASLATFSTAEMAASASPRNGMASIASEVAMSVITAFQMSLAILPLPSTRRRSMPMSLISRQEGLADVGALELIDGDRGAGHHGRSDARRGEVGADVGGDRLELAGDFLGRHPAASEDLLVHRGVDVGEVPCGRQQQQRRDSEVQHERQQARVPEDRDGERRSVRRPTRGIEHVPLGVGRR